MYNPIVGSIYIPIVGSICCICCIYIPDTNTYISLTDIYLLPNRYHRKPIHKCAFGKAVSGEGVRSIWHGGIISQPVRTGQHPPSHASIDCQCQPGCNLQIHFAIWTNTVSNLDKYILSEQENTHSAMHLLIANASQAVIYI